MQGYYFARPMPVKEYEKLLYEQPYFEDDETREEHPTIRMPSGQRICRWK
ncbi:MAG: hypothetical protein ACLVCH_02475 [Roseburia inulinivorans]